MGPRRSKSKLVVEMAGKPQRPDGGRASQEEAGRLEAAHFHPMEAMGGMGQMDQMDLEQLLLFTHPANMDSLAINTDANTQINLDPITNDNTPSSLFSVSDPLFGSSAASFAMPTDNADSVSVAEFMTLLSPYVNFNNFTADEAEMMLTPIISPAMTPSADFANLNLQSGTNFSPLSSPALRPVKQSDNSSSTNPGIKRNSRRSGASLPVSALDRKKKLPPRSPYTIPRPSISTSGVDPLKISSPLLTAISSTTAYSSGSIEDTAAREDSSSTTSEMDMVASPVVTSPDAVDRASSSSHSNNNHKETVFKVPQVPASKSKSLPTQLNAEGRPKSRTSASPSMDPVTPGMLMNIRSDDEKQASLEQHNLHQYQMPHQQPQQVQAITSSPVLKSFVHARSSDVVESEADKACAASAAVTSRDKRRKSAASGSSEKTYVSPALKPVPILPNLSKADQSMEDAVSKLTQNSNYQNIIEGDSGVVGFDSSDLNTDLESKKEHHKASEQRRRDQMKQCFDGLREVLPKFTDRNPSKEKILQFSRDYIITMQQQQTRTEAALLQQNQKLDDQSQLISELRAEIEALRRK
ncbi:hypothetical protein HDU78_005492 [Chytriomyces hyalinus]|nr:hypothetical protein HDU78_005492 [Chytriomyces hyalinus]